MDFNSKVEKLIDRWSNSETTDMVSIFKNALIKDIVSILYCDYKFKKSLIRAKNLLFNRFGSRTQAIKHILWVLFWSLKWFVLFPSRRNPKVRLIALGSDRQLTFFYISNIVKTIKKDKTLVISLNVICNWKFFLDKNVFYYPRFFYWNNNYVRTNVNDVSDLVLKDIHKSFSSLCLNINFSKQIIEKRIIKLFRDYNAFEFLITYILKKKRILQLIQDYDLTSNKHIYYSLASNKGIKTLVLDHALYLYEHIYKNVFSDYILVWGSHQKQRINRLSFKQPQKIEIIGHPYLKFDEEHPEVSGNLWLYVLQCYSNPSFTNSYRSLSRTNEVIKAILNVREKSFRNIRLILKPHPSDNPQNFVHFDLKILTKKIDKVIRNTGLIFTEDTTLAIELLRFNIPVIYIADQSGQDRLKLYEYGVAKIIRNIDDINLVIRKTFQENKKTNWNNRRKLFEYYFGSSKTSDSSLINAIESLSK